MGKTKKKQNTERFGIHQHNCFGCDRIYRGRRLIFIPHRLNLTLLTKSCSKYKTGSCNSSVPLKIFITGCITNKQQMQDVLDVKHCGQSSLRRPWFEFDLSPPHSGDKAVLRPVQDIFWGVGRTAQATCTDARASSEQTEPDWTSRSLILRQMLFLRLLFLSFADCAECKRKSAQMKTSIFKH